MSQHFLIPDNPRIDWGNPITRDLFVCYPMREQNGQDGVFRDIVKSPRADASTDLSWVDGPVPDSGFIYTHYGRLLRMMQDASGQAFYNIPSGTMEITIWSICRPFLAGIGIDQRIITKDTSFFPAQIQWQLALANQNQCRLRILNASGQFAETIQTGSSTLGQWHNLAGVWFGATTGEIRIWQNGFDVTPASPGTVLGPIGQSATREVQIGCGHEFSTSVYGQRLIGDLAVIAIWTRALRNVELQSLFNNPNQLFARHRFRPQKTIVISKPISGTALGVADATADLAIDRNLAGSVQGVATATAELTRGVPLSGTAPGVATVTAALRMNRPLAGTSFGVAVATGALLMGRPLAGTSQAVATATAELTLEMGLSGTAFGIAVATAELTRQVPLAGSTAGVATVTATLNLDNSLSGTVFGIATVMADLSVNVPLEGTAFGLATVTGALTVDRFISGTAFGAATVTANLVTSGFLGGRSFGVATVTADLTPGRDLAGTAAGIATATARLDRSFFISGSTAGVGSTTAALRMNRALAGTILGVGTATADLVRDLPLAATAQGVGSATATLTREMDIAGTSLGAATARANLVVAGAPGAETRDGPIVRNRLELPRRLNPASQALPLWGVYCFTEDDDPTDTFRIMFIPKGYQVQGLTIDHDALGNGTAMDMRVGIDGGSPIHFGFGHSTLDPGAFAPSGDWNPLVAVDEEQILTVAFTGDFTLIAGAELRVVLWVIIPNQRSL